jgi:hypothetical protein
MEHCRDTVRIAALAALLAAACNAGAAVVQTAVVDEEASGALIGELVFQADLLSALDRQCPRVGSDGGGGVAAAATDWHAALSSLLQQAFTPELRRLSRRLGADAGRRLVREHGGCHSSGLAQAYSESKDEYRSLLQRWRALGD